MPYVYHQHFQFCLIFAAVANTYGLDLIPSIAKVIEHGSINLTCRHESHLDFTMFQHIDGTFVKGTSTVYFNNCNGEGDLFEKNGYEKYCIGESTLIVTLTSVQQSLHLEHFRCRSFYTSGKGYSYISSNQSIIYVIVPVKDVILHNMSQTAVATMEGLQTVFVCITENVYPEPEIVWFANSTLLQSKAHNVSIKQEVITNTYPQSYRSILTMFPTRSDNSTMIYCKAKNSFHWQRSNATHMIVYFPPDTPTLTTNSLSTDGSIRVVAGKPLTIVCSSNSNPEAHFQWSMGNKIISGGDILYIPNVSNPDHAGNLTCIVTNTMSLYNGTRHGRSEASVTVDILPLVCIKYFNIRDHIPEHQTNVVAMENASLVLECRIQNDTVADIRISQEGTIVNSSTANELLYYTKATCTGDTVAYSCQGNNSLKVKPSTRLLQLFVKCKPRTDTSVDIQFNVMSDIHQTVTLCYIALAYPHPSFVWYRHGSSLNISDPRISISSSNLQTNLTITDLEESDFGQYNLIATNEFGSVNEPFHIQLQGYADQDYTTQTSPHIPQTVTSLVVGAVTGVVVGVVALYAVVFTVVICRRRFISSTTTIVQSEGPTIQRPTSDTDQLPNEDQGGMDDNRISETNVDHTYEDLSLQDNDEGSQYMSLDNNNSDEANQYRSLDNNSDAKSTYENLQIRLL